MDTPAHYIIHGQTLFLAITHLDRTGR